MAGRKKKVGYYPVPYSKVNFSQNRDVNVRSDPKLQRHKIKGLHDKKKYKENNKKIRKMTNLQKLLYHKKKTNNH